MPFKTILRMLPLIVLTFASEGQSQARNEEDCPPEALQVLTGNLQSIANVTGRPEGRYIGLMTTTGPACFLQTNRGQLLETDMMYCRKNFGDQDGSSGTRPYHRHYHPEIPTPRPSSRPSHWGNSTPRPRPSSRSGR